MSIPTLVSEGYTSMAAVGQNDWVTQPSKIKSSAEVPIVCGIMISMHCGTWYSHMSAPSTPPQASKRQGSVAAGTPRQNTSGPAKSFFVLLCLGGAACRSLVYRCMGAAREGGKECKLKARSIIRSRWDITCCDRSSGGWHQLLDCGAMSLQSTYQMFDSSCKRIVKGTRLPRQPCCPKPQRAIPKRHISM